MFAKTLIPVSVVLMACAGTVRAQALPSSVSWQIQHDLRTQYQSILDEPYEQSLATHLETAVPSSLASQVGDQFPTITDWRAFATDPEAYLTARKTAWETALPASVRSEYDAFQTSVAFAQASLVEADLVAAGLLSGTGATATGTVATTTTTTTGSSGSEGVSSTSATVTPAATTGAAVVVGPGVLGVAAGAVAFVGIVL